MTFRQENANDLTPRDAISTQTSRSTRSAIGAALFARVFLALEIQLRLDADRMQGVVRRFERSASHRGARRSRKRVEERPRRNKESKSGERRQLHFPQVLAHRALAPGAARAFERDRARL